MVMPLRCDGRRCFMLIVRVSVPGGGVWVV